MVGPPQAELAVPARPAPFRPPSLLAAAPWASRRRRRGPLCAPGSRLAPRSRVGAVSLTTCACPPAGKQFKCTVCDYTAAQKPQLLRHMEQHASFKVRARAGRRSFSAFAAAPPLLSGAAAGGELGA